MATPRGDAAPSPRRRSRRIGTRITLAGSFLAQLTAARERADERERAKRGDRRPRVDRVLTEYQGRPVEFLREVLGWERLSRDQIRMAEDAVSGASELSYSSGNGVGKSHILVGLAWYFFACFHDCLISFGSSVDRQVRITLWAGFRRAWRTAPVRLGECPGKSHQRGHSSPDDRRFIFGASPKTKEDVMGTRSPGWNVVLLDESPGIPDDVNTGYENLLTGVRSLKINSGNPTRDSGWFREKFRRTSSKAITRSISCLDTINVQEGREVIPGLVSREWVDLKREQWGEDDPRWIVHVLGRFLEGDETRIFPDDYLAQAWDLAARVNPEILLSVGIDIASGASVGGDRAVVYMARGLVVTSRFDVTEVMASGGLEGLAEWLKETIGPQRARITFDATGIGHRMRLALQGMPYDVRPVFYGQKARDTEVYHSARDEMPWHLRAFIRAGGRIAINPKREDQALLREELLSAKFSYEPKRRRIQSNAKDELRKKLGRSTDDYDALCLCVYDWETAAGTQIVPKKPKRTKREIGGERAKYSTSQGVRLR